MVDGFSFDELKDLFKTFSDDEIDIIRKQKMLDKNDPDLDVFLRSLHIAMMEFGVRQGWWEDFDERGPIPFPKEFHLSDFPAEPLLAHLAVKLEVFPSFTQACKNGMKVPLTLGLHTFRKGKIRAVVTN